MIHLNTLITILAMAGVTYLTRISGFLLLRDRTLSPRMNALMDILPGCVLIAILAPILASGSIANIIGLTVTVLSASRYSLLPTMIIGVVVTGLVRNLLSWF